VIIRRREADGLIYIGKCQDTKHGTFYSTILLISKLSINTIKSLYITYADLMVAVSSVSTNSVKRFFLAPI